MFAGNDAVATYWGQVERTYANYLTKGWDGFYGQYGTGGCNPWMLTIHSIRAGHLGLGEDQARAKALVDAALSPGVWNAERASWNVAAHLPALGSHPSVDSRYVEALYNAWRYRAQIGLTDGQVESISMALAAKAASAYHHEEWHNQENAYWYNNAICLAYEVTRERRYADWWQAYMDHFVEYIDKPSPTAKFSYLWPDFAWNYNGRMFDALEYGLMCYGGMVNYQRMHDHGLYAFTEAQLRKIRGYQQYVLGMWRLDGYPNWDTGYGHERLLNAEYWAFCRRALVALVYGHTVNPRPEDRHYARYLFDRGLELFGQMDTWDGDPSDHAMPLQPYGVGSLFGDKLSANSMFIADLCMAIDLGVAQVEPLEPKSLWRYNWYHRKLAVSTQHYSATIVPVGMKQFDYGGLELTGLYDGRGRNLTTPRPGHYPCACSLEIPEEIRVRTHNVGLACLPDQAPETSDGQDYFAVVESPDGELASLVPYDLRIFTPTFERVVAKGNFVTRSYRYDTRFLFEQDRIGIEREVSAVGQTRRGRVVMTVSVSQWIETVSFVDLRGDARPIAGAGADLGPITGLADLAYLEFAGNGTGFLIMPTRVRLGSDTAIWVKDVEGTGLYSGEDCRVVFLCLAGFGGGVDLRGELIQRLVFDAVWIPTDGRRETAQRRWRETTPVARGAAQ